MNGVSIVRTNGGELACGVETEVLFVLVTVGGDGGLYVVVTAVLSGPVSPVMVYGRAIKVFFPAISVIGIWKLLLESQGVEPTWLPLSSSTITTCGVTTGHMPSTVTFALVVVVPSLGKVIIGGPVGVGAAMRA